jgi:RNA polymerase sigma-70 factor (ECF subfamily)
MYKEEFLDNFLAYQNFLYHIALNCMKNHMDAEDAVQEAFIRAWSYCGYLEKEESLPTWLMRIVINECNNIFRKRKRARELFIGDGLFQNFSVPIGENQVIRMDLRAAIDSLDDRYRIPIQMTLLYGLSSEETASRLHMTRSAVSGMVRRGKERLRTAM